LIDVYTLKVYPQGMGRDVYRKIRISEKETLDKLCKVILDAFDFVDEHLYEFCMDNKMYSEYSYQSSPEYSEQPSTKIKLGKLDLNKGQKFTLHYDFGDDWMFTISIQKIEEEEGNSRPEIIDGKGTIEQYPVQDEDNYLE
jgi:hypothetical protein